MQRHARASASRLIDERTSDIGDVLLESVPCPRATAKSATANILNMHRLAGVLTSRRAESSSSDRVPDPVAFYWHASSSSMKLLLGRLEPPDGHLRFRQEAERTRMQRRDLTSKRIETASKRVVPCCSRETSRTLLTKTHDFSSRNGELFQPRGMPQLRVEEVKMLRQAMEPFMSTLRSLKEVDYPEQMFRVLNVQDFECKQRTICEIEQYLAGKGVAGFLLNFLR